MPFHELVKLIQDESERNLWIGHICSRGAEIVIPAHEVESMTDEQLVKAIRALVLPAKIADGFYTRNCNMLTQVGTEYLQSWKECLKEGLQHPYYANNRDELIQGISWADEALASIEAQRKEHEEEEARRLAKEAAKYRPDPGLVYLLQSPTGTYKIGRSKDLKNRMKTFHVKLPFEVELIHVISCERMRRAETQLHIRFADKRVNGSEFFALTDEDVKWIKSIERM